MAIDSEQRADHAEYLRDRVDDLEERSKLDAAGLLQRVEMLEARLGEIFERLEALEAQAVKSVFSSVGAHAPEPVPDETNYVLPDGGWIHGPLSARERRIMDEYGRALLEQANAVAAFAENELSVKLRGTLAEICGRLKRGPCFCGKHRGEFTCGAVDAVRR